MSDKRERSISDSDALDKIVERYRTWGQDEMFENMSSTVEFIGDLIEQTGRKAWFEEPGYLTGWDSTAGAGDGRG